MTTDPKGEPRDGMQPSRDIARLTDIMAALRTPETGCPWDLAQTFATIAPYTIEEAYEVADAIARGDLPDLCDELGDLLLQVVYHARLAEEERAFDFDDVVMAITSKMIRRHPHVFDAASAGDPADVAGLWERIKAEERSAKTAGAARTASTPTPEMATTLADVPVGLPALTRAMKLQRKAAKVGFDWPDIQPVFAKLREEIGELETEIAATTAASPSAAISEEYGDMLFVMANMARHLNIDPEAALRAANAKFTRRFAYIEQRLSEIGKTPSQSTLQEMDALWDEIRARDKL